MINAPKKWHLSNMSALLIIFLVCLPQYPAQTFTKILEMASADTPLDRLLAEAEKGDAEAQYNLGLAYSWLGLGISFGQQMTVNNQARDIRIETFEALWDMYARDTAVTNSLSEALKWLQKAAEQGHRKAQDALRKQNAAANGSSTDMPATSELTNLEIFKDSSDENNSVGNQTNGSETTEADTLFSNAMQIYSRALFTEDKAEVTGLLQEVAKLLRKSAEQGHAESQSVLGQMYENGSGVTMNLMEAVRWYRSAADQGNSAAQYNLGRMYASGNAVQKDIAEAMQLYRKSMQGDYWNISKHYCPVKCRIDSTGYRHCSLKTCNNRQKTGFLWVFSQKA
jgi:TPR repeat protein